MIFGKNFLLFHEKDFVSRRLCLCDDFMIMHLIEKNNNFFLEYLNSFTFFQTFEKK